MIEESESCRRERGGPGFRFSAADGAVIAIVGLATWLLWPRVGTLALLAPVVLAHFFLFCNVFRVGRRSEYVWAALFVVNVGAWSALGALTWGRVVAAQMPVTIAVIVLALTRKDYHGVGWKWVRMRQGRAKAGGPDKTGRGPVGK